MLGLAKGTVKIRVVYTDPALRRGFADVVALNVNDILPQAKLDSLAAQFKKLTIVAGDGFPIEPTANYIRGADHFSRRVTERVEWRSSSPESVQVAGGVIEALRAGDEPVTITATLGGKSAATEIQVVAAPMIQRIVFQVKEDAPRAGWKVETGQRYSDARGYGWLKVEGLAQRDDRNSAKGLLLKRFNKAEGNQFKLKVPPGEYQVRIAMGDSDYGATPFDQWVALGQEKLIYYQGHANNSADKIVAASDDGLTFTVTGSINYLIVAPVGIDLKKYADDGP